MRSFVFAAKARRNVQAHKHDRMFLADTLAPRSNYVVGSVFSKVSSSALCLLTFHAFEHQLSSLQTPGNGHLLHKRKEGDYIILNLSN